MIMSTLRYVNVIALIILCCSMNQIVDLKLSMNFNFAIDVNQIDDVPGPAPCNWR